MFAFSVLAYGIAETHAAPDGGGAFVQVSGNRFLDAAGREILLHGVSIISKSKTEGYTSWHTEADFARLKEWGMNCIRLGVLWDGLEPEPGQYDVAYLTRIDERIAWAKANGLFVLLDMHQDLFGVQFSDGAPRWATISRNKPHFRGQVWSDSYLISPAVQQAFDSFWENSPAPDGVGIQEHYARLWRMLATRYAGETAVLGYDLMNEPFMGSSVNGVKAVLANSPLAEKLLARLGEQVAGVEELMGMWLVPDGRATLMRMMEDMEIYTAFVDVHAEICGRFERETLMPMYQRVADAIREVDAYHILLLETNYHSNMGVYSAIEPLKRKDGTRDPQVAYAPHAYDIVVDTSNLVHANFERLRLILGRHCETAQRLGMPLLIGEWGAFGNAGQGVIPGARIVAGEFERLLASDMYWEYGKYLRDSAYIEVLQRPIPLAVAGTLDRYGYEPETGRFECVWTDKPSIAAPTVLYLPAWMTPHDATIEVSGAGGTHRLVPIGPDSGNCCLEIAAGSEAIRRQVTVQRESARD